MVTFKKNKLDLLFCKKCDSPALFSLDDISLPCKTCGLRIVGNSRDGSKEVIDFYSKGRNRCECCDSNKNLEVDHILGNGKEHRLEIGHGIKSLCDWIKQNNFPPGFQVLCEPCNISKHTQTFCKLHKKILTYVR